MKEGNRKKLGVLCCFAKALLQKTADRPVELRGLNNKNKLENKQSMETKEKKRKKDEKKERNCYQPRLFE